MLEKQIQNKVRKHLSDHGWIVVKIMTCSMPGWPDLQAHKNGRTIFIECKAPGKIPSPLQIHRHEMLRAAGFEVFIIDNPLFEI